MVSKFFSGPPGSFADKTDHISESCLNRRQGNERVGDAPSAIGYPSRALPSPPEHLNTRAIPAFHVHRPSPHQQPEGSSPTKIGRVDWCE